MRRMQTIRVPAAPMTPARNGHGLERNGGVPMTNGHYHGSCQCGRVAFDVDVDLDPAVICNCSRCRRLGSVLAFAPRVAFTLLSGERDLSEYRFNTRTIRHLFCRHCGIESFAYGTMPDGTETVAVNANCLDGVDVRSLKVQFYDGASL